MSVRRPAGDKERFLTGADLEKIARASKLELGILTNVKRFAGREQEYPIDSQKAKRMAISRNSPCTCGSGKRYKRCHGPGMYRKKKGKLFRKLKP
jgi:hypothetical protein